MGIQLMKQFTADATVCGATREIAWDATEGVFAVTGIHSFNEAMEIMDRLGQGGVSEVRIPAGKTADEMSEAEFRAHAERNYGYAPGPDPAARPADPAVQPPITITQKFEDTAPDRVFEAAKEAIQAASAAAAEDTAALSSKAEPSKDDLAEAATSEDLNAFMGHTKLAEAVAEIRMRGANTYELILAAAKRLKAMGDISPPLDQIPDEKLEERLKLHLQTKGVPVPA